jgi:FeS assembly SUF system protein
LGDFGEMNENRKIEIEEVESVASPPRARLTPEPSVADTYARKRDYLAGFLAEKKPAPDPAEPGGELQQAVVDALKSIYDPEIPVDIYELGLIYQVDIDDDRNVRIDMTLTAPGCPVAGEMPGWVENAVGTVAGVASVEAKIVFDPPWDQSRMSDEARVALNVW